MAFRLEDLYPGSTVPGNTDYPDGSFQNGQTDGTPFEQQWANDLLGFFDALLRNGEVIPDGVEDIATSSQRLQALQNIIGRSRAYDTVAQAAANPNYQIERIIIVDEADRLYELIDPNESRDNEFTDTQGRRWGDVTYDDFYVRIKDRWDAELIANLPATDTLQSSERSYITSDATGNMTDLPVVNVLQSSERSYITTQATTELENLPLVDTATTLRTYLSNVGLGNIISNNALFGQGGYLRNSNEVHTISGIYPDSGELLIESYYSGRRLPDTTPSITISVDVGNGVTKTSLLAYTTGGTFIGAHTTIAYAARVATGTPGSTELFTTIGSTSDPSSVQISGHTTIVTPI